MRRLLLILGAVVCLGLAVGPAAAQRGGAYCTLKEIKAEQLSNGVRITIQADGQLEWNWDYQLLIDSGALTVHQEGPNNWWIMPTEKFTHVPIILRNARSGLGSAFIPIGKYPVSHAIISIPDFAAQNDGIGLRVDIVNYLGWMRGEQSVMPEGIYYQESRYGLSMRNSEDSQGMLLIWTSDRFAPPPPPKTPEDLPTELSVTGGPGGVTVKAINARFQDVTNLISARTGMRIDTPPDADLRVTCDLWNLPPDKAVDAIAAGLGLCDLRSPDGSWLISSDVSTSGGYAAAESRRVPLRYLRARETLDLIPNYLLKYVQADEEGNALTVTGPDWMVQRVAEDLAKLDAAPREVTFDVTLVEYTSATALARALHLERLTGNRLFASDSLLGDVSFLWFPGVGRGWSAVLNNLEVESAGKLRSTASLRVLNGRQGRIFAGEQRTLVLQQIQDIGNGPQVVSNLETVSIGTTLIVQPRLGDGDEVMLALYLEANSLRATDPQTGLPEIGQRSARCSLRVRDNETVAIAGLQLADDTKEWRKIPLLGNLPLVGALFRTPVRSRSETQLAVFLTTHIVKPQTAEQGANRRG